MHFPGFAGFHHQAHLGAGAFPYQVVVHRRGGQQTGYGRPTGVHSPVRDDNEAVAVFNGLRRLGAEPVQGRLQGVGTSLDIEQCGQGYGPDVPNVDLPDLLEVFIGDYGRVQPKLMTVFCRLFEQVLLAADEGLQGGDQLLPNGVQGRVADLGEQLLEVVKEQMVLV